MKKTLTLLALGLLATALPAQTNKGAVLGLHEEKYDFDTLDYGAECFHQFAFTNTGTEALILSSVTTACGCDMPVWDHQPVKPGASGKLGYKYDSNRPGPFTKTMTVRGNFEGGTKVIVIKGYIRPKPLPTDPETVKTPPVADEKNMTPAANKNTEQEKRKAKKHGKKAPKRKYMHE